MATPSTTPDPREATGQKYAPNGGAPSAPSEAIQKHQAAGEARPTRPAR